MENEKVFCQHRLIAPFGCQYFCNPIISRDQNIKKTSVSRYLILFIARDFSTFILQK